MDKKLVEALETIKAECKQHRTCKDCVLWLGYACFLHMPYPCNWDIKDLEAQCERGKEKATIWATSAKWDLEAQYERETEKAD